MNPATRYPPDPARAADARPAENPAARIPWPLRGLMLVVGSTLLVLLVTASRLQPASQGYGTHQQLGLPPCTVTALFGIRCPSCGMTTSWSHFVRGRFWQSFQSNAGGLLLAAASTLASPWLLVSAVRGRWCGWVPSDWGVLGAGLAILVVTVLDWSVRLLLG